MGDCTEFCKSLGIKQHCCWACYENHSIDGKSLMSLPGDLTGLDSEYMVCCNCKYQWLIKNESTES